MSRLGAKPIAIPDGVTAEVTDGELAVKGPKGALTLPLHEKVKVEVADGAISLAPVERTKFARSLWGTLHSRVRSLIKGVTEGFEKKLEINGVGFRAAMKGKALNLQLGYSHEIDYPVPEGIKVECPDQVTVVVSGVDKQKVGQVAAEIKSFRRPEPYKGKGVKYAGEYVYRKEGKKK